MKGVSSLIRLHKWQLEQKRRDLVALERLEADLFARRAHLEEEIVSEQQAAAQAEVGGFAYGAYARHAIDRRETFARSLAEIGEKIAAKRAEVNEALQELKRYEIALRDAQRRLAVEEARREQGELDEIALAVHRRA